MNIGYLKDMAKFHAYFLRVHDLILASFAS